MVVAILRDGHRVRPGECRGAPETSLFYNSRYICGSIDVGGRRLRGGVVTQTARGIANRFKKVEFGRTNGSFKKHCDGIGGFCLSTVRTKLLTSRLAHCSQPEWPMIIPRSLTCAFRCDSSSLWSSQP